MMNNFWTIKWFNSQKSNWIVDYIFGDNKDYTYIISENLNNQLKTYSFIMSRKLSEDIYVLLEQAINLINSGTKNNYKIINLGFQCCADFVRGSFNISLKKNMDLI